MNVRYTRRAQADVVSLFRYLDQQNPQGSANVRRELKRTIELIADFPHLGRPSGEQNTRVLRAGRYPYLIYWSIGKGEIVIAHIRHTARAPWRSDC